MNIRDLEQLETEGGVLLPGQIWELKEARRIRTQLAQLGGVPEAAVPVDLVTSILSLGTGAGEIPTDVPFIFELLDRLIREMSGIEYKISSLVIVERE